MAPGFSAHPRFIVDGSSDIRDGDVQVPDDVPTAMGAGNSIPLLDRRRRLEAVSLQALRR